MWDILIAQAERGADTLIQKITGKDKVEVADPHGCFFRQFSQCHFLQVLFCLFPGFLAKSWVVVHMVEASGQRAFSFFFATVYVERITTLAEDYTVEFESDLTCDTIFSCPVENGEKILHLYNQT